MESWVRMYFERNDNEICKNFTIPANEYVLESKTRTKLHLYELCDVNLSIVCLLTVWSNYLFNIFIILLIFAIITKYYRVIFYRFERQNGLTLNFINHDLWFITYTAYNLCFVTYIYWLSKMEEDKTINESSKISITFNWGKEQVSLIGEFDESSTNIRFVIIHQNFFKLSQNIHKFYFIFQHMQNVHNPAEILKISHPSVDFYWLVCLYHL